jgi:hypothetical protein
MTDEHCRRCNHATLTELPPLWVRRVSVVLAGALAGLPLAAPFLASDPVLTLTSFLGLGIAVGPAATILRAHGSCGSCRLEREGFALRRLGVWRYLRAAS